MQQREKILAAVFLVVMIVMFGRERVISAVYGPINDLNGQIDSYQQRLDDKEEQELAVMRASGRMADWMARSLPPDELDAQRAYLAWMTDLAETAGFAGVAVTPGRISDFSSLGHLVEVNLEAEVNVEQLSQFLKLFETANLLHRIDKLTVEPRSFQPDTVSTVKLAAQGVAFNEAKSRPLPYSRWELAEPFQSEEETLKISRPSLVPLQGGFDIAVIDGEKQQSFKVISVAENGTEWKVKPNNSAAKPVQFSVNSAVSFSDQAPSADGQTDYWADFRQQNPFTLPPEQIVVTPQINLPETVTVVQGDELKLPVPTTGISTEENSIGIEFPQEEKPNLRWDAATRTILWQTALDTAVESIPLTVWAKPVESDERIEKQINIQVAPFNHPPELAAAENFSLYAGEEWTYQLEASDEDLPDQSLAYAIQANGPDGMQLDAKTGQLKWTPPIGTSPAEIPLEVSVTDNGTPAKSATVKLPLKVVANLEMTTELYACIRVDGEPTAWFRDTQTGKRFAVAEGNAIELGRFGANLENVASDYVVFSTGEDSFRLNLGQLVSQRTEHAPKSESNE